MKKVCIITSMIYPVPATKGGAVEGLVELLVKENEATKKMELTVVSVYDEEAKQESAKYKNTKFIFVDCNSFKDRFFAKKIFIYANKVGIKFKSKTLVSIPFAKKIWKTLENEKYDRYILEGGGDCYNFGYLAKKIPASKFFVHIHGEFPGDNAFASWFGKCITVSNFVARRLICNGIVDSTKVRVLPNCFDSILLDEDGEKEKIRAVYGVDNSDFLYVYWGRLIPQKGVLELLQAFLKISGSIPRAKLLIVGNATFGKSTYGDYDNKLQKLCESEELKDKVVFTGFVPHEKIGSILAACDVGVIPSIWDDPAPLTVFEGLSKGLPLIASRTGGIPEIVHDEDNGLLADWNENFSETLAEKMNLLYSDKNLRTRLKENAVKSVENYNSKVFYNRFIEIIK